MKQTAVEWLKSELTEVERNLINKTFLQLNNSLAGHKLKDIFEQAKEMEKASEELFTKEDLIAFYEFIKKECDTVNTSGYAETHTNWFIKQHKKNYEHS